nr:PREDICTED: transcriptional activator DEMETER-like [Daucus carota subsp. sativus]
MSIYGIGLKSTECIRLLTLRHVAFPVDTNVGRVAVRLGWVPLKPLPEGLQLHLLETYPPVNSIQTYLYPRLCNLDQQTLYELHYHLITFGKVFCTKKKPNCNACPMKGECKYFASATASFELPDSHPILERVDRRDPDDPSPYLFAVWEEEGELSGKPRSLVSQISEDCRSPKPEVCHEIVCCGSPSRNIEKQKLPTICGTLLIPVRSANHGTFPLNGTYFQVNEVFADDESTQTPIVVPRQWLLGLPIRFLYCGRTATTTFKGLSADLIQHAFSKGFFCTRGFNRKTKYTTCLGDRFHFKANKYKTNKPLRKIQNDSK